MEFRVLQEQDAVLYRKLRLEALQTNPEAYGSTYEREAAFPLETVIERIQSTKDKFTLGAFLEGGFLAAIVTFVRESGTKSAHKGNIYGIYVSPDYRGKGLGKALVSKAIALAREWDDLEQIHLTVVSDNIPAIKLYESLGFEVYGTERMALQSNGKYYDEDLMVLFLNKEMQQEDITGITCIYVPVNDVFESITWYRKNLGYQPAKDDRVEPGMKMAVLNVPDRHGNLPSPGLRQVVPALFLHKSDEEGGRLRFSWSLDNGKPHAMACFITPRIEELRERLKQNGVTILRERVTSGPNITFVDPDGNLWEAWQP